MEILVATNNIHKLEEIRHALRSKISVISLKEAGIFEEIPESSDTLEGNAIIKAMYIYEKYGFNCFADDTGLEVYSLNNNPGVRSSRYAGPECDAVKNMDKLLNELKGMTNRKARFRTVIAYVNNGKIILFEGLVEGSIAKSPSGKEGFGYDPLFLPEGYGKTFAEMTLNEKNRISHRNIAMRKFIQFLEHANK